MKLNPKKSAACVAFAAGLCLAGTLSAHGGTITKANNTLDLTNTLSWVGGNVPQPIDVALWDGTVAGGNTVGLGADASWQGIQILNPGGLVTINGANTLSLGASGIDMSAASADLTLAPTAGGTSISCIADQTWNIGSGRTLTITPGFYVQNGKALTLAGSGSFVSTSLWQVGAAGSSGTINHIGGTWSSGLANAIMFLGYSDALGNPGVGIYNLNGGTIALTGTQEIRVGTQTASGQGTFNLTNGTISSSTATTYLRLGYSSGAMGTYRQVGGSATFGQIDCPSIYPNTLGILNLSVGSLNVSKLNVGNMSATTGSVMVVGGVLSISNLLNLGVAGMGSLTLSNTGWINLYGALSVGSASSGSSGTLNLNGGTLNIASNTATMTVGSHGIINANGVTITNGSTGSITLSAPMTLGAGGLNLGTQAVTHNVTVSATLTGAGGFSTALGGSCNTYFNGNNSFSGPITIKSGYFHNSGASAIPVGCNLTNNAQWAMDKSVTLGSFGGSGGIFRDGSQGSATLTVGYNNADGNYSGSINEGTGSQLSLTKIGNGSLTLGGTCGYTGNTTVSGGTLLVDGLLKSSLVNVLTGSALGGGGTISNNVNLASGAKALFSDTRTLTMAGILTGSGNTIHLNLSSNVPAGNYLLATCGSGATGAFALTPVIDTGSFAPGTINYYITTLTDSQVWLVVQNENPPMAATGQFTWPTNQFLPTFPTHADLIDVIDCSGIGGPLSDLFASLQGIVNRSQPRIACISSSAEEGKFTWLTNHVQNYRMNSGYNLISQYSHLFSGLVVPDPNMPDTLNLATTIAGVTNALICDPSLLNLLTNAPYNFPIVEDLRGRFTSNYQVYGYLYTNYWPRCTHRIITGLQTNNHGNMRDYAVAVKSACVWLNPGSVSTDATALTPFINGMQAVGSVWMGWVPNEGSDVSWLSQRGIPVLASDYYQNGSLYSGVRTEINMPAVPPAPPLQKRIYVCFLLSDGDNVAYMQHKMRSLWNSSARGQVPIGWTTSPLACDIDPQVLNYYWSSATTNDCLVSGPSGAGYAKMEYWGAANAYAFTTASSPYLQKAGHHVVSVWDNLSTANGKYYGTNCPTVVGLIDQGNGYYTSTSKGKIPVMGMPAGYSGSATNLFSSITNAGANWNGSGPIFIPVQGNAWSVGPSDLLTVANALNALSSNYVIVRPDTMFLLYKTYRSQPVVMDPPPGNLQAIRRYNGSITLTWTGSTDADRYKIYRSTSSGTETFIGSSLTTSFTDTGVADDTTYYYKVSTENILGESSYSSEVVAPPVVWAPNSYAATLIANHPLAYWPLNESSGTVAYDLAGGYDGTYTGGFTLAQPGIPNGGFGFPGNYSVLFDGTSGRVGIPQGPFNLTNAITVMAWVKVPVTPHFSGVVGRGDTSWRLTVNASGKPGGDVAHVYGDATSPGSIVGNDWHMLTYVYSGTPNITNNGQLYVDAVPMATNTVGVFAGNGLDVWIGGSPDYGTSRLLPGSIAQVAVFTNALSALQVQTLYNVGTNATPMIGLIPLPAGSGMEIVWSQGALLQSTNLAGPWNTNTATSPCTISPTNSQMFFRVW